MALHTDPTVDQLFQWSDNSRDALDIEPIYANDKLTSKADNYGKLRKWTSDLYQSGLMDSARSRAFTQVKNLALWTGLHYANQTASADFMSDNDDDITVDTHKVIINNIYDIERARYSKISRNIPQVKVRPKSSDYDDYVGARVGDAVLQTAKKRVKQKQKVDQMLRESFIFGESWIKTWWNKEKGEIDPRWEKLAKRLRKDEQKREMRYDGELIVVDKDHPMFIGDHDMNVRLPWSLLVDPQAMPEACEWIVFVDFIHVEALKRMYPKKEKKITAKEDGYKVFNTSSLSMEHLRNHVLVYTVFARSSRFLRNGTHYVCTDEIMLEKPCDNPAPTCEESEWGNLPVERLTDIDVPGRLFGYSTIQILANLQHSENQMTTMMKHYLMMLGHPKMLIPGEAKVEMDELSDGSFYCTYYGDQPPTLLTPNPIPPQVIQFAEYLRDRMQKLGDLHGVSSGDIPNSVRAAKAIRLLQELEDLRATSIFAKYNDLHLALDRKILKQCENYKNSDGRMVAILGKGSEYLVEDFDAEVFSKEMQVELEVSGMLPQQPSARAEFITDMYKTTNGQLFSQEKWVKLLGFENEQEFIDAVTVSVIKAQRENDMIIKGRKLDTPEPFENHITELREHMVLFQSATFRMMNKKNQEALVKHVRTHEYLVYLHMQENPMYKDMVFQTCPWYPLVFKLPQDTMAQMGSQPGVGAPAGPAMPPGQMLAAAQGQQMAQ